MSESAIAYCLLCAVAVSLISLISSQLYRKEPRMSSELMSLISFAPGFALGVVAISWRALSVSDAILAALLVKNALYSLSFYLRYESLRKFGPFVGALMLGTQPLLIFLFGLSFLGESLSKTQCLSAILIVGALALLATSKKSSMERPIQFRDFIFYFIVPTVASTLAIVWDRFFLRDRITSSDFFVLDRLTLVPAFVVVLLLLKRQNFWTGLRSSAQLSMMKRHWPQLLAIALLFTVSVWLYNLALVTEKAAVVGLFRNSGYVLAAFLGVFLFRQKIHRVHWLSLILVLGAILFSAWQ